MIDRRLAISITPMLAAAYLAGCSSSVTIDSSSVALGQATGQAETRPSSWREAEDGVLSDYTQLTFADRFYKAGEAYFSPDDQHIVFQAVETPRSGEAPAEFYGMYIADVVRDRAGRAGRIIAIDGIRRLSPDGSANTCGWFHPSDPNTVFFATTMGPPSPGAPPGYDRQTGRYKWMFPPEMQIVRCDLSSGALEGLIDEGAYCAEGGVSPDGQSLVYCSLASGQGDLYVYDFATSTSTPLVTKPGYDGGPFFSPDGNRICYRSDRHGDHLLQLFVGDLARNDQGKITGLAREHQLTDNGNVNWAPFWHPDGRHLLYATSEVGHHNYEVYLIDADSGDLPGSTGSIKYGTRKRRVTHADRADVLPVFSHDGRLMLWTSQRGEDGRSQLWVARFDMDLDPSASASAGTHGR